MPPDPPEGQLAELASRLGREGLCARLTQPPGRPPRLHVLDPGQPLAEEHVIIERDTGGPWFWWACAERLAPTRDMDEAVSGIRRVLGAT